MLKVSSYVTSRARSITNNWARLGQQLLTALPPSTATDCTLLLFPLQTPRLSHWRHATSALTSLVVVTRLISRSRHSKRALRTLRQESRHNSLPVSLLTSATLLSRIVWESCVLFTPNVMCRTVTFTMTSQCVFSCTKLTNWIHGVKNYCSLVTWSLFVNCFRVCFFSSQLKCACAKVIFANHDDRTHFPSTPPRDVVFS